MDKEKQTVVVKEEKETSLPLAEQAHTDIRSMIYVVRNQQIMIDSDLAMLYQVETRRLNESAKRSISRFPERFRFQLTKEEYENLKSQFATSSLENDNGYFCGNAEVYGKYIFVI